MTAQDPPAAPRRDPAAGDYGHHRPFPTRWHDNDAYGHLNNTIYYAAMDSTITDWLLAAGGTPLLDGPTIAVCASSSCEFRRSASFPDALDVGLRVGRLGTSSITWELGLFRERDGALLAEGRFVHVLVERASGRPTAVPQPLRTRLEALGAG